MSFNMPQNYSKWRSAPQIKEPFIVGYMSVDGSREYHSDLSQLKFLNSIPRGIISLDLNHNLDKAVKRTTEDNTEKIELLLKFLLDQKQRLSFNNDTTFVTYRRTLISVMCSAFGNNEPIQIVGTLFKNHIYLCSLETEHNIQRRQSRSRQEVKFCAWGYKFEQYLLSDGPSVPPNIERPVIENEEFSLYYYSEFGKHRLLYGAQIDGLLATSGSVTDPPKTDDVETNLNYLRNNSFLELKTNREILHYRQEHNFKKHKLLRCWCQCYLAGLKGLLVGFRNDSGIIQRLQWYDTHELVRYCKYERCPESALSYLDYFLTFVENSLKYEMDHGSRRDKPLSLQFDIDCNQTIRVCPNNDEKNAILPDWFINNCV